MSGRNIPVSSAYNFRDNISVAKSQWSFVESFLLEADAADNDEDIRASSWYTAFDHLRHYGFAAEPVPNRNYWAKPAKPAKGV
jgi:hypothetical protein